MHFSFSSSRQIWKPDSVPSAPRRTEEGNGSAASAITSLEKSGSICLHSDIKALITVHAIPILPRLEKEAR